MKEKHIFPKKKKKGYFFYKLSQLIRMVDARLASPSGKSASPPSPIHLS
jgi:hypothetical protein